MLFCKADGALERFQEADAADDAETHAKEGADEEYSTKQTDFKIRNACAEHPEWEASLLTWYKVAKNADWAHFPDVVLWLGASENHCKGKPTSPI